jgi:hypothetical protein
MRIEINIGNRQVLIILLFIIAVSAAGLVLAYGGSSPAVMGHTWGEIECASCITNSNLADSSVTSAKIADGAITNADISPTLTIDGSKITGTVPNSTNAQTMGGKALGVTVYVQPGICGGGVTASATCSTICCYFYGDACWGYYTCSGSCTAGANPASCTTTYLGTLLA